MKQKILFSFVFLLSFLVGKTSFGNCNNIAFTTLQAGNTLSFSASVPAGYVINTYYWTFGDGGNSNAANPSHTYSNFGWYNACMTISGIDANNGVFQCTYCDSVYIPNNAPCSANYTYTTSGLSATFTNQATGPGVITNYAWNFGDGNQSNLANPVHTYANSGSYYACLTIYGVDNGLTYTCSWCDSVTVNANNQPCNASFISTVSGNTAAFTNTAAGPGMITSYAWTFGDGGTSSLPNPNHTYANAGWYNVCLAITGIDNNQTYTCNWCDSIYVQAGGNPCLGVTYNTSQLGNAVTFSAAVPAGYVINTYYWTFGDGGNSNLSNPTHTYANPGWYSACMVISGTTPNNGTFQCTYCDSINVGNVNVPCSASFLTAVSGLTATFTNTATGPGVITNYAWNFGDGNSSNLANPVHTYAANGVYNVCLTIYGVDNGITYTCMWCDSIAVGGNNQPCVASFVSTASGLNAAFSNTATGPGVITGYAWTFGDGGTSILPNPSHTYATSGLYNVCLTISGIDNNIPYSCTWCDSIYVQGAGGNPCNGVSYNTTQAGNAVTFNAAVPAGYVINTYYWTFGDGGNSNLANPTHTYANPGWYNACMVISGTAPNNVTFQCTYCDSIYVQGGVNPCSATFISTANGLTAAFTNTATGPGAIIGYAWTFGDGGTSALPNPSHTYATTGWYNVCLTITGVDNGLTYTCNWCDSIYVQGAANPCNGVAFNVSLAGNTASFNAVVPGGYVINTYNWTFGDGGTSVAANPSHTYANNGYYNVCMVISGMANNTPFQCSVCDSIQVFASGINETVSNTTLQVFPNPTFNSLTIKMPAKSDYRLKVYDVAGKLLTETVITDSPENYILNTAGLSKGLYFIQLISDGKRYQTNFVKQ